MTTDPEASVPDGVVDMDAYKQHKSYMSKATHFLNLSKQGVKGAYEKARHFQIQSNNCYMAAIGLQKPALEPPPKEKKTKKKPARP